MNWCGNETPRCVGTIFGALMIDSYCKEAKAMDRYVTGAVIRRLSEKKKLTQEELSSKVYVSS